MFFNSYQYLLFLPIVLIFYFSTQTKYRWVILFGASCIFYMYFIPKYILCLFFLIVVDYYMAIKIAGTDDRKKRKYLLLLSIISNFGLLFYFKYFNFFVDHFNVILFSVFGIKIGLSNEILPIGLSFHTFQSVSYVIDVYRRKIKPETHIGIYSTYVLFFPQMVAGPIERFSTLGQELKKNTSFNLNYLKTGLSLIITGFFYKMVIADNCGEYVNHIYSNLSSQNRYNVLLAIFLFCVQVYADFFGYSLIAQGSAKLFGISLIDNFSFPFYSQNIIVFWKKWHMSLTSWFRDYVYLPLGGSKTTTLKHSLNILIVFTLSGLWHGAGTNFILWGLIHSVAYLAVLFFTKKINYSFPKILGYFFTFTMVSFIFVFFRNGKLSESMAIFTSLYSNLAIFRMSDLPSILLINLVFIFTIEFFAKKYSNYSIFLDNISSVKKMLYFCYFAFAILVFSGVDNIPFIYFQF